MLEFGSKLLEYCKVRAQEGKPLSWIVYDENHHLISMTPYDEAYGAHCPCKISKTKQKAIQLIRDLKYLLSPIDEDLEILGDYYEDYIDAVCRCIAKIDYSHLIHKCHGLIDYDFYDCCLSEGLWYNRWHYVTSINPELQSYILQQGLYTQSDELKYIYSELKKTRQCKEQQVAVRVNNTILTLIPGFEVVENTGYKEALDKYTKFINSKTFQSDFLPKLPDWVSQTLLTRTKKKEGTTRLCLYIAAIKYQCDYIGEFENQLTFKVFELSLGFSPGDVCKNVGTTMKGDKIENDPDLKHIRSNFPKFNEKH